MKNRNKNNSNTFSDNVDSANELYAPLPYVKYLPAPSSEISRLLLNAHGVIECKATNNYTFQALLQENQEVLNNLVCSVLHWSRDEIKSIEITNPITLGKYISDKIFILDIKAIMNDDTIINLEMQLTNYHNWPERSLGYLCRSFDNLNKGEDYASVKTAIHIGFLDFTLFPDSPEFHAIYQLQNRKSNKIYTDKFMIHVICLNCIHMATKEDKHYETDKWAAFFKANTWEELSMLANQNPEIYSAAETLYQLNMDEQFRETVDRFVRAQARENAMNRINAELTQEVTELTQANTELTQEVTELTQTNTNLV